MRKIFCLFLLIFMIGMIPAEARAADPASPRIILFTWYDVLGEDDLIQFGSVDEKGVIRTVSGMHSDLEWLFTGGRPRFETLSQPENFSIVGSLGSDELFSLKSLLFSVEDQDGDPEYAADDAGTEESWAVRYSEEGEPEFILLGMSGESVFENTDPNAQALYRMLRRIFPDIISFAYDPFMGPAGFVPMGFAEFAGLDPDAVMNAGIEGFYNDCEEGLIPLALTDEDRAELLDLIRSGKVTGKADCLISTGDIYTYVFRGSRGEPIGTVEFEGGLLLSDDGRYYFEIP